MSGYSPQDITRRGHPSLYSKEQVGQIEHFCSLCILHVELDVLRE